MLKKGIFFILLISGNLFSQNMIYKNTSTKIYKILPLGNSITYDDRANDTRNIGEKAGYRRWLYALLKNAGYNFDFIGSEHSGGNYLPAGYDDNGGFPGITDDELFNLLQTGHLLQDGQNIDRYVTAGPYLNTYQPDIILLHIGTNGNDQIGGTSASDVEKILDQIDAYENTSGNSVIVLLARIINRSPNQSYVNTYNDNIVNMALDRVNNSNNDAYPDKIKIVNMQDSAGLIYTIDPFGTVDDGIIGDMSDNLHPNDKGYKKMANEWFKALKDILPSPPIIIEQPKDQYTVEGQSASFVIHAQSSEQLNYQWKKNGSNISLAKDSVLKLSNIQLSDSGASISCSITNVNGTVISQSAKLIVGNKFRRISNSKIAEYEFEEGEGSTIHNNNDNLDLIINSNSSVQWIKNGLQISNSANISTTLPASDIIDSINNKNQFSIELWFSSSDQQTSNSATIFTVSSNASERNFNFNQNLSGFIFSTRTTNTNLEGIPEINFQTTINTSLLTHIVFTRNNEGIEKIYFNGQLSDSTNSITGDLSNWDNNYKLAIANNLLQNQPWLGSIYYLSIYNRELNTIEIQHNFSLGESGVTDVINENAIENNKFELSQNYPNPFNPTTTIRYSIPANKEGKITSVQLIVYDVLGREVATLVNIQQHSGNHEVSFDGKGLSSGIYYYQLKAGNFIETKKMIMMK